MVRLAYISRVSGIMVILFFLGACAETRLAVHSAKRVFVAVEEKPEGVYKIGNPYQISGTWYYPKVDYDYDETGIASWYGKKFHGRKTANGETYNMNQLTAAHRTLPMPCYVRVTNLENGRSLVLKVNDRGPFAKGRIIDISRRGAQLLKFQKKGIAKVRVNILANKSRELAYRMKNQEKIAKVGSPITIKKLPKPKVTSEAFPPPKGSKVPEAYSRTKVVSLAPPVAPLQKHSDPAESGEFLTGKITQTKVRSSNIYIQAGAFSEYTNANRVQARLAFIGPVKISNVLIKGQDIYRVRVGPVVSVASADKLLEMVANAGYKSARIVVD